MINGGTMLKTLATVDVPWQKGEKSVMLRVFDNVPE